MAVRLIAPGGDPHQKPLTGGTPVRAHFLALCSRMMRRILLDHARRRGFAERGGNALRLPLDDVLLGAQAASKAAVSDIRTN